MISRADLVQALTDAGIPVPKDMRLTDDGSLNLRFTDRKTMFCKVTRPSSPVYRPFTDVAMAQWAHDSGISTITPLHPDAIVVGDTGHLMTVWPWVDLSEPNPGHLLWLINTTDQLHHMTPPVWAEPGNFDAAFMNLHGLLDDLFDRIVDVNALRRSADLAATVFLDATADSDVVFTHGDPQLRNMGVTGDGTPVLFDWELAGLMPREWDFAKIIESTHRIGGGRTAQIVRERLLTMGVSDPALMAAVVLRSTTAWMRMIEQDAPLRDCGEMRDVLDWARRELRSITDLSRA